MSTRRVFGLLLSTVGVILLPAGGGVGASLCWAFSDAVSRESVVLNTIETGSFIDAVSREVVILNRVDSAAFGDAVSREVVVLSAINSASFEDAVSREIAILNKVDRGRFVDAASRELTVFNDLEGVDQDFDGILTSDGDGTFDPCPGGQTTECDDNCPLVHNRNQRDGDGDGAGDACDAPVPVAVSPADNSLEVPEASNVDVTFSEALNPATVTASTFRLLKGGAAQSASVSVSGTGLRVTLDPAIPLDLDMLYTIEITSGLADLAGQPAVPFTSRFRTTATASGTRTLPSVSDEAAGVAAESKSGTSVSSAGDLDRDGFNDFIAGAPGLTISGESQAGAALIYLGDADTDERKQADILFTGEAAFDRAGVSVAGGFDFNGDGTGDILIGAEQVNLTVDDAPGCNAGEPCGPGKAYLIFFDPSDATHYPNLNDPDCDGTVVCRPDVVPLSLVGAPEPDGIPGVVFMGGSRGDQAGFAVAGGGRVNPGLGHDLLIGAPGRSVTHVAGITPTGTVEPGAGTAYVIFDAASICAESALCDGTPQERCTVCLGRVANSLGNEIDGVVYEGELALDHVGYAVAFPGDVMGTIGDDLAIGAPDVDAVPEAGGVPQENAGTVYVVQGGLLGRGIVDVCRVGEVGANGVDGTQFRGDKPEGRLGYAVSGGGDNLANGDTDLLMGAPRYRADIRDQAGMVAQTGSRFGRGIVDVCRVGEVGANGLDGVIYHGEAAGDELGTAVAGVMDVTGNGFADVALGAPYTDPDVDGTIRLDAGTVYVIEGLAASTGSVRRGIVDVDRVGNDVAGERFVGTQPNEHAGSSLAGTGDMSGDGFNDFVAGAPDRDVGGDPDAGTVYEVTDSSNVELVNCGPVNCGAAGCQIVDLETGAQADVPAGSLTGSAGLCVRGVLLPTALPAPPPQGTMLLGAADFDPEGQSFASPLPTLAAPVSPGAQTQVASGESLPVFFNSEGMWMNSGLVWEVGANPQHPAQKALSGPAGVLRFYAVFLGDLDSDGTRDELDLDRDGDGTANGTDNCPDIANPFQTDCDLDGTGDACETGYSDADQDRVDDACDLCPDFPAQDNRDSDADSLGEPCDPCPRDSMNDQDGDQVCVGSGYNPPKTGDRDNCPTVANASQRDGDHDGVGDACDTNPRVRVSSDPSDTPDFGTIQAAVSAATQSGTRIEILPGMTGVYNENVVVDRGMVFQFETGGPAALAGGNASDISGAPLTPPIIVDGGSGPAFDVQSTSGGASMRFRNLVLRGQRGIRASVSTDIADVRFESIGAAALELTAGAHTVSRVTMDGTVPLPIVSGVSLAVGASLHFADSILRGLAGSAMDLSGAATVETCLIARCEGGISIASTGSLVLRHATIADSAAGSGVGRSGSGSVTIAHTVVYGNAGGDLANVPCGLVSWSDIGTPSCAGVNNSVSADPLFVDPAGGDYRLQAGSTLLDHGPNPATFTGAPCFDLGAGPRLRDHSGDGLAEVDPGAYERAGATLVPGEVAGVRWTSSTTLTWNAATDASEYHIYRGLLASLSYASGLICRDDLDPERTDRLLTDPESPPRGEGFYYDVSAEGSGNEGTLGSGTCAERGSSAPCP